MANWIKPDYRGLYRDYVKIKNPPVNLDEIVSYHYEGYKIVFVVPRKENIEWQYLTESLRNEELDRIDKILFPPEV